MFGLKVLLILIYFTTNCRCGFSELVDVNAIINDTQSTQLPGFDDQIVSGNEKFNRCDTPELNDIFLTSNKNKGNEGNFF